jgi:hypothetical protein
MNGPLFGFRWRRPVGGAGFELREVAVVDPVARRREMQAAFDERRATRTLASSQRVMMITGGEPSEAYEPLEEESGLFKTFAWTEPTAEGCLAFANRFGHLGDHHFRFDGQLSIEIAEVLSHWQAAIRWMRYLVEMWEAARTADRRRLAQFAEVRGDALLLKRVPEGSAPVRFAEPPDSTDFAVALSTLTFSGLDLAQGPAPDERWVRLGNVVFHGCGPSELCEAADDEAMAGLVRLVGAEDPVNAALLYCAAEANEAMHDTRLRLGTTKGSGVKLRVQVKSSCLWTALWLQFALAMAGDRRFQQCSGCDRWFELNPDVNRADKVWCSDACRVRATRRRREHVLRLHREGRTVREIVKQTGAKPESVKAWITKEKKGE